MKQLPDSPANTEEFREWLWGRYVVAHYEPPLNVDETTYLVGQIEEKYNRYVNGNGVYDPAGYAGGFDSMGFFLSLSAATCGNNGALEYVLEHAPTEAQDRRTWLILTYLHLILDYPATIEFERDGLEPILDWFKENKKNLIWNTEVERFVRK